MEDRIFYDFLKKHSTTFYYGSLFFPKEVRKDVAIVYSFLRTFDDIVDVKNDKNLFISLKNETLSAINDGIQSSNFIINSFVCVFRKYSFEKDWLNSFFASLEMDIKPCLEIQNRQELNSYIYGVAGVVGLMMARIMNLNQSFYESAIDFGQAMQIVNIIRDIKEDLERKRVYIPKEDIKNFGLNSIDDFQGEKGIIFDKLIRFYLDDVFKTFSHVSLVTCKIPCDRRKAIDISKEIYKKLATVIYNHPRIIWHKRVSLSKVKKSLIFLKYIFR